MKLTDWEAGQELIKASDCLGECYSELKETHPRLAEIIHECRLTIGDHFNKLGSHEFGLPSHKAASGEGDV